MNKEQFLAMSLPYQTIVCVKYTHKPDSSEYEELTGIVDGRVVTGETEEDDIMLPISDYSIILHPLSDLTKEINHKGKKIVPLSEIIEDERCNCDVQHLSGMILNLNMKELCLNYPFWVVQKLVEWHFDVALLIEKGQAININTLSKNPYA